MQLSDLTFSDLFVAALATNSWYKATPDSLYTPGVPAGCHDEVTELRKKLDAHQGSSDFRVEWPNGSELRFRVRKIKIDGDETIYVCRRPNIPPRSLHELGMPTAVAEKCLEADLKEGLVLFLGKPGSGKTTTAGSFVIGRLSIHGGVCWTVENPIELRLQGRHGKGVCYQTEVISDNDIGNSIRDLYRATPNIIMVGELRDGWAVKEAAVAATSGCLVAATLHSPDLITGLSRLAQMAGDENTREALAYALRIAIHLDLRNVEDKPLPGMMTMPEAKGTGSPPRVLSVEPIWFTGELKDSLKSMLRDGDYHMLKSEIQRQRRVFMNTKLP